MASKAVQGNKNLSHIILDISNKDIPRIDFFYEINKLLLEFSGADAVELLLIEEQKYVRTKIFSETKYAFSFELLSEKKIENWKQIQPQTESVLFDLLKESLLKQDIEFPQSYINGKKSLYLKTIKNDIPILFTKQFNEKIHTELNDGSLLLIPLSFGNSVVGVMQFHSTRNDFFKKSVIKQFEGIAEILVIAELNHRNQAALHERVKELTCLYKITQISKENDVSLSQFFRSAVEILPPAWQYPEITSSRIVFDGQVYSNEDFREGWQKQIADIVVKDKKRGFIEIIYSQIKPEFDEGPFLKEERKLIDTLAKQIAMIVERREAEKAKLALEEQLRHTDRLALIGQLAAGVAHELNEPLGSILGFAQLFKKNPAIPEDAGRDIDKIVKASLYAREVIKKLLVFAREVPAQLSEIDFNTVIIDGLYFFEARCAKQGIEINRFLAKGLPKIQGDASQLNQVLINLVVNSIQAMPGGGKMSISTSSDYDFVYLTVEDTGVGISEEVISKIFLPFFTTKDVNEGTGLGLAVVHGIVTSHGGKIKVESRMNQGAKFEIKFPRIKKN